MARSSPPDPPVRPEPFWPAVPLLAVCVLILVPICQMTGSVWSAVAAGVLALALCALLLWSHRAAVRDAVRRDAAHCAELERRDDQWRAHLAGRSQALEQALEHLVHTRFPAAARGEPVPPPAERDVLDEGMATWLEQLLAHAVGAVKKGEERQESLRLAMVSMSRRVQTAAHRIQETVTLMSNRHPRNPDVLESSMHVDHAAAQQARHAQSVAVLCGEWPGQQWPEPFALVDVVRAGSARIVSYERVQVTGDPDLAVAADVVEPLIHTVAELLANATQSSPPATVVSVSVRTVQRGAVIEIDDSGVGMDEYTLEHARELISGVRPVGVSDVGELPRTGLPVVGCYVRRHAFRVDLMHSPYGGVRVVLLVPSEVVEILDPAGFVPAQAPAAPEAPAPPAPPPAPSFTPASPAPADTPEPVVDVPTRSPDNTSARTPAAHARPAPNLPRRRSRRAEAETLAAWAPVAAEPAAVPTPEEAGAWMQNYFDGGPSDGTAGGTEPGPVSGAERGDEGQG